MTLRREQPFPPDARRGCAAMGFRHDSGHQGGPPRGFRGHVPARRKQTPEIPSTRRPEARVEIAPGSHHGTTYDLSERWRESLRRERVDETNHGRCPARIRGRRRWPRFGGPPGSMAAVDSPRRFPAAGASDAPHASSPCTSVPAAARDSATKPPSRRHRALGRHIGLARREPRGGRGPAHVTEPDGDGREGVGKESGRGRGASGESPFGEHSGTT